MTTLREQILSTIASALKEGRRGEANTLRFLMAQVKNQEIELHKREEGLSDEEMTGVIMREVKRHKDSIAGFEKGGRDDLVVHERAELAILERYAPSQMSEEEIKKEAEFVIRKVRAVGDKDFGKVMGVLMPRLKEKAEGAAVSKIVRDVLRGHWWVQK